MNIAYLTPYEIYLIGKQASAEILKKSFQHTNEILSSGKLSLTGHHRKIQKRPIDNAYLLLGNSNNFALLTTLTPLFKITPDELHSVFKSVMKVSAALNSMPLIGATAAVATDHIAREFVNVAIAQEVDFQVAHQIKAVGRIATGDYHGPLREDMQTLATEFQAGRKTYSEFQTAALQIRGISIQGDNQVLISGERLTNLRSHFTQKYGSLFSQVASAGDPQQLVYRWLPSNDTLPNNLKLKEDRALAYV
jgi:hypothetical protein